MVLEERRPVLVAEGAGIRPAEKEAAKKAYDLAREAYRKIRERAKRINPAVPSSARVCDPAVRPTGGLPLEFTIAVPRSSARVSDPAVLPTGGLPLEFTIAVPRSSARVSDPAVLMTERLPYNFQRSSRPECEPPMERYRVSDDVGLHFVTMSVVEWLPVFVTQATCQIVADSLNFCHERIRDCGFTPT